MIARMVGDASLALGLVERPLETSFVQMVTISGPGRFATPTATLQAAPLGLAWHPGRCPGLRNHGPLGRPDTAWAIHQHPRRRRFRTYLEAHAWTNSPQKSPGQDARSGRARPKGAPRTPAREGPRCLRRDGGDALVANEDGVTRTIILDESTEGPEVRGSTRDVPFTSTATSPSPSTKSTSKPLFVRQKCIP